MSDPKEDLRAALREHQGQADARSRIEADLQQAQENYEAEERRAIGHLHDVADLIVSALNEHVPAEDIPVTSPRSGLGRLFPRTMVEGWKVSLDLEEKILCRDGTLITQRGHEPRYSTLKEWVDTHLYPVHSGYAENLQTPWREAFTLSCAPYGGDRARAQKTMYARLNEMKEKVTGTLAGVLSERDISL